MFGAFSTHMGLSVLMANEGYSISYIFHKLHYYFVNLTLTYFAPLYLLAYWQQHKALQTPAFKFLLAKTPLVADEHYVSTLVIYASFVIAHTVSAMLKDNDEYQLKLLTTA